MIRRAFTLMELLVVIVIIGMLASMTLGGIYLAQESAKKASTQATITKIDRIIQDRMNDLTSRRLPMPSQVVGTLHGAKMTPAVQAEYAKQRLRVIRWIAKVEMPDHYSDVVFPHNPSNPPLDPADLGQREIVVSVTGMGLLYDPATHTYSPIQDVWEYAIERTSGAKRIFRHAASMTTEYDVAELLYMIVTSDSEAREQFRETEIGDIDGDGCREFHDAWGMPIFWLRWPTGYVEHSELMTGDPDSDHDVLDSRKSDPGAFRTVPLIWSFGPDKLSGLDICDIDFAWDTIYSAEYGKPVDASHAEHNCHLDNITNHSLGMN